MTTPPAYSPPADRQSSSVRMSCQIKEGIEVPAAVQIPSELRHLTAASSLRPSAGKRYPPETYLPFTT